MGTNDYDNYFDKWEYEITETEDDNHDSRKTVFKELPLNKFYAILNNYKNQEDAPQSLCSGYIITNIPKGHVCLNFCKKFMYKIKHFSSIKEQCKEIKENEFCNYFKYWLGEQLLRIDAHIDNISQFRQIFNTFSSLLNIPGCTCKIDEISGPYFKKMKKFSDYAKNLESINNSQKTDFKNMPDDIYCYYIAKAVSEYNKVISDGSCASTSCAFKEELERFKGKFINYQDSFRTRCPSNIIIPCIQISKDLYHTSCPSGTTVNSSSQTAADMPAEQEDGGSDNSNTLATTSASAAVGTIFTSLILYKVTDYFILINMSVTLTYV
ncbi:hypothetical protein PVMG_05297 [Plasmodium vivax Mauritania I]|uniref:Uncharacterized protein n=1 Tax=Plasmodium vivax Mauritania I TaxID=1035515 RepID=A0A0J9W0X5_PLAVI|nr:hypothetical protein PVMG_05297 [Plasmodium vivax Mauritania I]